MKFVGNGPSGEALPCGCSYGWSVWFHQRQQINECDTCKAVWYYRQGKEKSEKQRFRNALEIIVQRLDQFYSEYGGARLGGEMIAVALYINHLPTILRLAKEALSPGSTES